MVDSAPSVSVLIAAWNAQDFIRDAVSSVLEQDYPNLEIVVVNDGSTDATVHVLNSLATPNLVLINLPINEGIPRALNAGLAVCSGKYIARLDADDICLPGRLRHQVKILENDGGIGVLGGSALPLSSSGADPSSLCVSTNFDLGCQLLRGNQLKSSTVMIRHQVLTDHNLGYNVHYPNAQDFELWFRISRVSRIANDSQPVALYRYHSNQQTSMHFQRQLRLSIGIQRMALNAAKESNRCTRRDRIIGYFFYLRHLLLLARVRVTEPDIPILKLFRWRNVS